jgi:hypothetical protein
MRESKIVYFSYPGKNNTDLALQIAAQRAVEKDIGKALIATTSGSAAVKALDILTDVDIIAVSHSYGFKEVNKQELTARNREAIEGRGGQILTCQHAFGGVGRAVRKKFGTYELEEIIANTFRTFGEGTKVCVEIAMMAVDAGLVNQGENIITIAGTASGADTAMVIKAANAQLFFDLRIQEILCKPLFK